MLPSKTSFIDHVRWLRWAAGERGAQVLVELDSMRAFVRKDGRHWALLPRFSTEIDGTPKFFAQFDDEADHLAGWAPPQPAAWPCAKDKLTFKRAARHLGLRVPDFSVNAQAEMYAFLVKRAADTHGLHVHGPYAAGAEHALQVALGDYRERFVEGRALKVWYLGDRAIALEMDAYPTVTGDGASSLRQLIDNRVRTRPRITPTRMARILDRSATLLRYDGLGLDDVPAKDHAHRIEFRHGSEVMQLSDRETIDLRDNRDPAWQSLVDAGASLAQLLPDDAPASTMYTVDAVLDAQGQAWLLQMSSLPVVHPLMYGPLIESLVSTPAAVHADVHAATH